MNIDLDLPLGKWRDLRPEELIELNKLCEESSKTI
jgi:23S rRNA pseudouridine2604 synthase